MPKVGPKKLSVGTKSPTPMLRLKSAPIVGAGKPYIASNANCFLVLSLPAHSIIDSLILSVAFLFLIHSANGSAKDIPGIPIRPAIVIYEPKKRAISFLFPLLTMSYINSNSFTEYFLNCRISLPSVPYLVNN